MKLNSHARGEQQWRNWRGGGGHGGQMLPWQLRCGPLFRNGPPLIQLPWLPKQFYKHEPLAYTNLFFATAAVFCKALRKSFLKWYLHCQDC